MRKKKMKKIENHPCSTVSPPPLPHSLASAGTPDMHGRRLVGAPLWAGRGAAWERAATQHPPASHWYPGLGARPNQPLPSPPRPSIVWRPPDTPRGLSTSSSPPTDTRTHHSHPLTLLRLLSQRSVGLTDTDALNRQTDTGRKVLINRGREEKAISHVREI